MSKYIRKTDRQLVSHDIYEKAVTMLESGIDGIKLSKREVARCFGIAESSLRRHLNKDSRASSLGRFLRTFTNEQEERLAAHIRHLDDLFYGLTLKQVQSLAYEYAEKSGLQHRFNTSIKLAGRKWLGLFLKRHNLSVRSPEKCSNARASGFNRVQFDKFFNNLAALLAQYNFGPDRIYNVDESGLSTVPNKLQKIISPTGKKTVSKIVTAERGETVTIVCCMSAAGNFIPPGMVFPRMRMNPSLFVGAPMNTKKMVSPTGFINSELFVDWLEHFHNFSYASEERPVLLILDNHASHCSLAAIEYCRMNNIVLMSLPPHSSHKMQPLDRTYFFPLKAKYTEQVNTWTLMHPGESFPLRTVSVLFCAAYYATANMQKGVSGFECTGIYPHNKDKFDETDFAPSTVTDQSESDRNAVLQKHVSVDKLSPELLPCDNDSSPEPETSSDNVSPSNSLNRDIHTASSSAQLPSSSVPILVTPSKIIPLPKAKPRVRKRKGMQSCVLTSSPVLKQKREELQEKKEKEQNKVQQAAKRIENKAKRRMKEIEGQAARKNL